MPPDTIWVLPAGTQHAHSTVKHTEILLSTPLLGMFLLHSAGFDQAARAAIDDVQLGALCWTPGHAARCCVVVVVTPARCSPTTGTLRELSRQGFWVQLYRLLVVNGLIGSFDVAASKTLLCCQQREQRNLLRKEKKRSNINGCPLALYLTYHDCTGHKNVHYFLSKALKLLNM